MSWHHKDRDGQSKGAPRASTVPAAHDEEAEKTRIAQPKKRQGYLTIFMFYSYLCEEDQARLWRRAVAGQRAVDQ